MKVENTNGLGHINSTQANKTKSVERDGINSGASLHLSVSGLSGKDEATLSESARMLAKARTGLGTTPDVRKDVVESLHEQIQSGVYQIPYDALAKRLLAGIKGE
jgi:flagellar biosynthesis anti-sigma factor FlgM